MKSKSGPSAFANQDWTQFDFTKWNLRDLKLDDSAKTVAGLAQKLFASPQWQKHFKATLPEMKEAALKYFEQRADRLKAESARDEGELKERLAGAKKESAAFQHEFKTAGAPPLLKAEPNSFQVGAKVVAETTGLGLPGLHIRIVDERHQGKVLAQGTTDLDGNAVLFLNKEQANEMAHSRTEPTVEVLTPDGKSLHRAPQALCPRPNHAETWVGSLAASKELEPHISLADETKAEREAHLANLQTKMDRLKTHYKTIQENAKCRLDHAHEMIEGLRKEARAGEKAPGPFSSTERPHTETSPPPSAVKPEPAPTTPAASARPSPLRGKTKAKRTRKTKRS